jgi:hypothetical protein
MFGLLVLICFIIMLGFVYVWIANVVAHEEVPVMTGVVILIVTGVVNFAVNYLLGSALGRTGASLVSIPADFLVLAAMTHLIAKITFKQSLIIAGIFTALIFLFGLALGACSALAG